MAHLTAPYPWLTDVWDAVTQRLESGRLPHALLIAGPPGWGQREFALALGRRILSLDASGSDQPIVHPDFRLVTIEEGKRQILIDQIRALNEFAFQTAGAGGAKVAMISPVEALNHNAANALLKTLEEPTRDTHILLSSTAAGRLPPTIVSRCQRITVGAQGQGRALEWLLAQVGPGENTDAAIFFAGGAPLTALELIREGSLEDARKLERELLDFRGEAATVVRLADGRALDELLDWWLRIAVRWQRTHVRCRQSFEFIDALLRSKSESLAVPTNTALVVQHLHRRWCDLPHNPEHSH